MEAAARIVIATEGPTALARRLGVSRQRAHQIMHKDKHRARVSVQYALKTGELVRPKKCERCDKRKRLHAHHGDYSQPLTVQWVCVACHVIIHPHHPYSANVALGKKLAAETRFRLAANLKTRIDNKDVVCALRARCESLEIKIGEISLKTARLNGVLCEIGKFSVRANGIAAIQPRLLDQFKFKFSVRYNVRRDIWMIIPADRYPQKGTSFILAEPQTNRRGAYSNSHGYRAYIEAWHLLAKTEGASS